MEAMGATLAELPEKAHALEQRALKAEAGAKEKSKVS
jgi:hypothetical protein